MNKRLFLKAVAVATASVMAVPKLAYALYSDKSFKAETVESALTQAFGAGASTESSEVRLKAPDIAENGAVVPVEVETDLPAENIAVLIHKNPAPLAFNADIPAGTQAMVKTRCRMGETTKVTAVVKSDGNLYTATKEVKVTIGGCGG